MVPYMGPHTRKSTYSEVNKHALLITDEPSFIVSKFQVSSFKIVKCIWKKVQKVSGWWSLTSTQLLSCFYFVQNMYMCNQKFKYAWLNNNYKIFYFYKKNNSIIVSAENEKRNVFKYLNCLLNLFIALKPTRQDIQDVLACIGNVFFYFDLFKCTK